MSISAAQVKELRERTGAAMMDCKKALQATDGDIEAAIEQMRKDGMAKADKKAGRVAADGIIVVAEDDKAVAMLEFNSETDFVAKNEDFVALADSAAKMVLKHRPADVDALLALDDGNGDFETQRKALVAKIGENMSLRRFEVIESTGGAMAYYQHGARIGTVVALADSDDKQLAKDLAMHIAASNPQYRSADDVPADVRESEKEILKSQVADSGKPADIIEKMIEGRLRKYLAEITLYGQPFVKDPDITVEKLLASKGASVGRYVRFEVGEGIEKQESDFASEVAATAKATMG
ncbi:translation elongation factor Ts [Algiphilus aromaticivorans]|uniref:translation elongation factor Ts n=1 Tax=Algiphilus aromaticivorans TaxID=382454 RepID=UPI0005C20735|nr:translation elongation factor Ts [Algiphilus aromaticivorans]